MSFFGFNAVLPERRDRDPPRGAGGFSSSAAAAGEDIAVYTWGEDDNYDGLGDQLMETGDEDNDDTFGGGGRVGTDFQYSQQPLPTSQYQQSYSTSTSQAAAKLKPTKPSKDLFASTEADFFGGGFGGGKKSKSSRQTAVPSAPKVTTTLSSSALKQQYPPAPPIPQPQQQPQSQPQAQAKPAYKTLEEIEAEVRAANAHAAQQQQQQQHQSRSGTGTPISAVPAPMQGHAQAGVGRPLTLEEIEREMMAAASGRPGVPQQVPGLGSERSATPGSGIAAPPLTSPPTQSQPQPQSQLTASALLQQQLGNLALSSNANNAAFPPLGAQSGIPIPQKKTDEELTAELERRIQEQEVAEMRRRRKGMKIQSMAKYNDIMTGGDKEFITRIQLSQLVTANPYASDFYAQVMSAITASRNGPANPTVLQVGDGKGVSVGLVRPVAQGRKLKETAMQRMTVQVKRIVDNAQKRATAAPSATLQGALGKNKLRVSATAPRPALQVTPSARNLASASNLSSLIGNSSNTQSGARRNPLTSRQIHIRLEQIYEVVLDLEQARRETPIVPSEGQVVEFGIPAEEVEEKKKVFAQWESEFAKSSENLWQLLMVSENLEISNPHPFISLLDIPKGHKLFNRVIRLLSEQQCLAILVLLVACYPQLDVVRNAPQPTLTSTSMMQPHEKRRQREAEAHTESFLMAVIPVIVGMCAKLDLKMVAGLVGLCASRWDVAEVLSTRPGVALFTILFSRAEMLKHIASLPRPADQPPVEVPSQAELDQWTAASVNLLRTLIPSLPSIFPSTRAQRDAFGPALNTLTQGGEPGSLDDKEGLTMDLRDGEAWGLIASFGLQAPPDEQTALVGGLRDKILHTVHSAKKGWVSPARAELRLRNVNLFLNGLGLSTDMIE